MVEGCRASPRCRQNDSFKENWNCRGFSIVLGSPNVEDGVDGINKAVPIGVGATLPPGTEMGPAGQATEDEEA